MDQPIAEKENPEGRALYQQLEIELLAEAGIDTSALAVSKNGELFVFVKDTILSEIRQCSQTIMTIMLYRVIPGVVPAENRRRLLPYKLDCTTICHNRTITTPPDAEQILTEFGAYTKAPPGFREIYQVHPVFVAKLAGERVKTLWQLKMINKDMVDYELAALFLWWVMLPKHLYDYFIATHLHMVDLQAQLSPLSELLEFCRQQAACCGCSLGTEAFYWIRRYKSLAGRRIEQCDIEQEMRRYHPSYNYRRWGTANGVFTRDAYLRVFQEEVNKLADKTIANMRSARLDTMSQWWEKRLNSIASGSSSNRHILDKYTQGDSRIKSSDRPNKKAVMEAIKQDYFGHILGSKPKMIARRSTKHEPGLKQRALYAVDDEAVIISAFASQNMEKHLNFGGMCPLQRPIDVLDWWKAGKRRHSKQVWLSADFTDFNKEHSTIELSLLNMALARAWIAHYPLENIAKEKAFACMWIAEAQWTRFVKDEEGVLHRVFSALFSGSRDTARDNTMLHQVYHNMIVRWLDENRPDWGSVIRAYMCGDDEDVIFSDPIAAAYYYFTLTHLSWHANDSKQMCGYDSHEFLQKFPHPIQGCIAPIASMFAALCSGQWYTTPGLQQDNALAALSDQLWELIVRGADVRKTYLLGIDLLNDYMQVREKDADVKYKLEWWTYRFGKQQWPSAYLERALIQANNTTALWYYPGATEAKVEPPKLFYHIQSTTTLPHHASNSWCKRWYKMFMKYSNLDNYKRYVLATKAASYGSLYHSHLQDLKRNWLIEKWPRRSAITQDCYSTVIEKAVYHQRLVHQLRLNVDLIHTILEKQSTRVAVETIPQKLAKVGADALMYELLGGERNDELSHELRLYEGRRQARHSWIEVYPQLKEIYLLVDPALRSFLTNTGPDNS